MQLIILHAAAYEQKLIWVERSWATRYVLLYRLLEIFTFYFQKIMQLDKLKLYLGVLKDTVGEYIFSALSSAGLEIRWKYREHHPAASSRPDQKP